MRRLCSVRFGSLRVSTISALLTHPFRGLTDLILQLCRDPSLITCNFEEPKEPAEKRKRGTGPSKMAMMEAKIGTRP